MSIKNFLKCHQGILNILLHLIGVILVILGLWHRNIRFFIGGWLMQELGHLIERKIIGNESANPLHCKKEQLFLFGPIVIIGALYILYL